VRTLLRIEDLHVSYGRIVALRGVSITVEKGEIVGLIGANGAGKSTLLATVTGLLRPASGTVTYEGASLVGTSPERIVRRGIALVPEGRRIFGSLTVAENLQLGGTVTNGSTYRETLALLLERFPVLERLKDQTASRLSGGEQQQLAIARALLTKPRLLLLDEPSLGLAPLMIDAVFDALADLSADGVTILLVEQNALRTVEFAQRTYVLRAGEIVLAGTRDELLDTPDLANRYLGF
jgi:branched-chain amino acid transport system ATP-binding protein